MIYAAPVTYTVGDEQLVSIISGRNLMTFALPKASVAEPPALAPESEVAATH